MGRKELNQTNKILNPQLLAFPFRYFDIIWYGYIANQDGVSYAKMIALFCFVFELSPTRANFIETLSS